jgi:cytidylate kinase
MPPRSVEASSQEQLNSMSAKQPTIRNIVICLAGMTGCGKSTVARRLAEKFKLKYVSGGLVLKESALRMGYKSQERGWWETTEGICPLYVTQSALFREFRECW